MQDYKFSNNCSGFPLLTLNKILNRLNIFQINYVIYEDNEKKSTDFRDNNSYDFFVNKVNIVDNLEEKRKCLISEIDNILNNKYDKYNDVLSYLKSINEC